MECFQVSSYLTAVLSNVERRFGLQSKEVAWIYSGNEISQIALVFFLPLIGKVRKRPLWLGVSNCFAAVGIFIIALPHFICKLTKIFFKHLGVPDGFSQNLDMELTNCAVIFIFLNV